MQEQQQPQMPAQPQGGQAQNFGRSKARNIRNRRSSLRHRSRSRRSIRFRSLNLSRRRIQLHQDPASINSHISRSSLMATHSLQGRCRELTRKRIRIRRCA